MGGVVSKNTKIALSPCSLTERSRTSAGGSPVSAPKKHGGIAQMVRAIGCRPIGCEFEPHYHRQRNILFLLQSNVCFCIHQQDRLIIHSQPTGNQKGCLLYQFVIRSLCLWTQRYNANERCNCKCSREPVCENGWKTRHECQYHLYPFYSTLLYNPAALRDGTVLI